MSKATFSALSLPHPDGNFFLRPDRILGMFVFDPDAAPPDVGGWAAALAEEAYRDQVIGPTCEAITDYYRYSVRSSTCSKVAAPCTGVARTQKSASS